MNNIFETTFKNISGICVQTETLRAIFLPEYGAKLVSLVYKPQNYELLAQDENPIYLPQSETSNYTEQEVSAADDLFPTIDPCKTGFANDTEYPCHGETLRVKHDYVIEDNKLVMSFTSKKFGYRFVKTVYGGDRGELKTAYEITNLTNTDFPCIFGLHCMLRAEAGGKVITFEEPGDVTVMFDENAQFGARWEQVKLAEAMLTSDPYAKDGNAYKYYLCDKKTVNQCGYFNPVLNKNVMLSYQSEGMPYLGIWMNNGKFKGMYNVALEPCSAPYDSPVNAKNKGCEFLIKAGETYGVEVSYDVR